MHWWQVGAHAYLFKDATSDELLTTIRRVSRGGRYLSPAVGNKLDRTSGQPDLTARELVRGLSNARVAAKLAVTEETVKTRVGNIIGKLGVASRSKAVAPTFEC
jgi:DNA-binding NarL/FixJ family response regulator